jgi:hypothetical protein
VIARIVAPVVVVALLAGLAGMTRASTARDAATITYSDKSGSHTVHIRRDTFEDDLRDISKDKTFAAGIAQVEKPSSTKHSVDAALASGWLNVEVQFAATNAEFEARKLSITADDRAQAKQAIKTFKIAKRLRTRILNNLARNFAVARSAAPPAPSEADLRAYYEQNKDSLTACASGRGLAVFSLSTQAEADAVKADLDSGKSLEEVAAARTTNPSQPQGVAQCLDSFGPLPPEIDAVVTGAKLDTALGPVSLNGAFFVMELGEWAPTFESLHSVIEQQVAAQQQGQGDDAQQAVQDRITKMRVHVDPRYGTWSTKSHLVEAPKSPSVRTSREQETTPASDNVLNLGGAGNGTSG